MKRPRSHSECILTEHQKRKKDRGISLADTASQFSRLEMTFLSIYRDGQGAV